MDLQARKIEFLKEFLKLEEEASILRLEKILQEEQRGEQKNLDLQPMSLEKFYADSEESLSDSKAGRVIKGEELLKEIKEWH